MAIAVLTKVYRNTIDEMMQVCGYSEAEIDYLRMRPDLQTIGGLIQNILLAAYSLSYGSCWLTGPNFARHELEHLLNISHPWSLAAIIAIGRVGKEPGNKKIKPLDNVLEFIR